jgi:hypothetical protein
MPNPYPTEWQRALGTVSYPVEIVASLNEQSINHILAKHFEYDRERYTLEFKRTLSDGQYNRDFLIRITAESPIVVELPPVVGAMFPNREADYLKKAYADPLGWDNLSVADPEPKLYVPKNDGKKGTTPNIRIFCSTFKFHIEWPKLEDNTKKWEWDPAPLNVLAEGRLTLENDSDGYFLRIEPTRIKFDKASKFKLAEDYKKLTNSLPASERSLLSSEEDKFNDLLIIALNIAAVQFGPQLVKNVRLPMPVLAKQKIAPVLLELNNKIVTLGASINKPALTQNAEKKLNHFIEAFAEALAADIEDNGGLNNLVVKPGQIARRNSKKLALYSDKEIDAKLVRTNAILKRIKAEAERGLSRPRTGRQRTRTMRAAVDDGFGIGINEYFLNAVVQASMPNPVDKCTDEQPILDLVKGWLCYWVKLFNPGVTIAGTQVSGRVQVDIGGAIHACVRKFWDCSWKWDCGELSLALKGNPGINVQLKPGDGLVFGGSLDLDFELDSNLPWPFNEVVKFFSKIAFKGIEAILNLFLGFITIEIFPPAFALPEQKTRIQFSNFVPYGFIRNQPQSLPLNKRTFIAYTVGVSAVK